jgi:hypothetical protein
MLGSSDPHAPVPISQVDGLKALVDRALPILTDPSNACTKTELASMVVSLKISGLYSWWVDDIGAAELTKGLGYRVRAGLIYAGQAGGTHAQSGKTSAATLAGRLLRQHFNGRTRSSTFRRTIGSILSAARHRHVTESEISQWMSDHLRVVPWPNADARALFSVERSLLSMIDPPLNLDEVPSTPLRKELTRLRKSYRRESLP